MNFKIYLFDNKKEEISKDYSLDCSLRVANAEMNEIITQPVQPETNEENDLDDLNQIKPSQTCIRRNKPGTTAQVS